MELTECGVVQRIKNVELGDLDLLTSSPFHWLHDGIGQIALCFSLFLSVKQR